MSQHGHQVLRGHIFSCFFDRYARQNAGKRSSQLLLLAWQHCAQFRNVSPQPSPPPPGEAEAAGEFRGRAGPVGPKSLVRTRRLRLTARPLVLLIGVRKRRNDGLRVVWLIDVRGLQSWLLRDDGVNGCKKMTGGYKKLEVHV